MTTSDGISKKDWDKVESLALDIVNVSAVNNETEKLEKELLKLLNDLKNKYGRLPSIIATEADYVSNTIASLKLLKEAYISALEINDLKNISYIAGSITEYYSELNDDNKLDFWMTEFNKNLKNYSDDYLESILKDLT